MARFFEARVETLSGEVLCDFAATMGSAIQFCDRLAPCIKAEVLDPFTGEWLDVLAMNAELARLAKLEKEQVNAYNVNPVERS